MLDQQLQADIGSIDPDVVIVTETWLTERHIDELFMMPGYTLFRRDRHQIKDNGKMRRGGGVAIYVSTRYTATVFVPSLEDHSDRTLELLWIRVEKQSRIYLIGGIYHPPKPTYHDSVMFQCIEHSLDEMPLGATVCLCGDFNNLSDDQVQSLGLLPVKTPPTRGTKQLDRIYVSREMVSR